ncbi:MAG: phenylalanine--tRNA ligase subunit alpha [Corynebacterium sp.]|nr:phenylalanine--tRNA ligase subunit alpha [Corynebacterium sp.]
MSEQNAQLAALEASLLSDIAAATDEAAIEAVRIAALGKKGSISEKLKTLGAMSAEERQVMGPAINGLRDRVSTALSARKSELRDAAINARLVAEKLDVTLPVRQSPAERGRIHPISQVIDEITAIFGDLGFAIAEGPDVETDYYNFTALNFPEGHPAREMHDTFFFEANEAGERKLLRTHTSPVQIRSMLDREVPLYIACPGRVFRTDELDATHTPVFHQIEGLAVDKGLTMAHLRGTLDHLARELFGPETKTRMRSNYFPFTEPSAEVDVWFPNKKGGAGWIEWGGCGMVNPNVLRAVGIDPEEYTGFAFGMGIERTLQFRNGLSDMRDMVEGDVRFTLPFGIQA